MRKGIPLPSGSKVSTGQGSHVDLHVNEGIQIRILPESSLQLELVRKDGRTIPKISLEKGGLLCLATDPGCETNIWLRVRTLAVFFRLPGEYETQVPGDTAVYRGGAALWEGRPAIRNVRFIEKGYISKVEESREAPLPRAAYAQVRRAFSEMRRNRPSEDGKPNGI